MMSADDQAARTYTTATAAERTPSDNDTDPEAAAAAAVETVPVAAAEEGRADKTSTTTEITLLPSKSPTRTVAVIDKVKVHFQAVGSAPLLKKAKFQIQADQRFAAVTTFLRKMLRLDSNNNNSNTKGSSLFLYCNSAFCPGPDELVGDLRDSFAVRDELVIHYSLQEAWG